MPIDVASGKKLAQQLGQSPPPEWRGNEDGWYIAMLKSAVDAGDPRALKAAGMWTAAESGLNPDAPVQGYASDFMSAAPSSEWLGKRKPTPRELRRYAADSKQSEDYARMSDAQLANWIGSHWDAQKGAFFNDFGDRVEKPTESGPQSLAAGAATGIKGVGPQGGGGGGAGGGGGKAKAPASSEAGWMGTVNPDLQNKLLSMFSDQAGYFSEHPGGIALANGGLIFRDPTQNVPGANSPQSKSAAVAPGAKPAPPQPVNSGRAGGNMANSPPLVAATLNAFGPQAPSLTGAGTQPAPAPTAPASAPAAPTTPQTTAPVLPGATAAPTVPPIGGALTSTLQKKFSDPSQWWRG